MEKSKVLLFDQNFQCFASLSRKTVTENFLKKVVSMEGSFIDCPIEMVGLISGKDSKEPTENLIRDIRKF